MMKKCLKLLFIVLLASTGFAYAEDQAAVDEEEVLSGQELLDSCSEGAAPGVPNQYCMKYVFGLVQVVDTLQQAEPGSPKVFCIDPNLISLQEVTEATTNWLKGVPNRLSEDAYKLVTESLHANYPCSSQKI